MQNIRHFSVHLTGISIAQTNIRQLWEKKWCCTVIIIIIIIFTLGRYVPRGSLKIKIIHKWVQIISPCSQWLARCRVTIQRCSAAPAPKLSGTEKLLPSHRLTPRRSFLPDWQTVGMPTCSSDPRYRRDRRKEVLTSNAGILYLVARSSKLCCSRFFTWFFTWCGLNCDQATGEAHRVFSGDP